MRHSINASPILSSNQTKVNILRSPSWSSPFRLKLLGGKEGGSKVPSEFLFLNNQIKINIPKDSFRVLVPFKSIQRNFLQQFIDYLFVYLFGFLKRRGSNMRGSVAWWTKACSNHKKYESIKNCSLCTNLFYSPCSQIRIYGYINIVNLLAGMFTFQCFIINLKEK